MHRFVHAFGVARPIKPGHQHIDAVAQANEEPGEQGDKNAGGANRAQRRGTGKAPHNRHVGHVEQHLKQIRECQRQTDDENLPGQRPLGQASRS